MIETSTLRRTIVVPDPDHPGRFLRVGQDIEVEIRYPCEIDSVYGECATDWRVVHSLDRRQERRGLLDEVGK